MRQARGAEMPESFWTDPLMYQGASDEMLPPRGPIALADEAWGCDLEAEVVVVTGDVPRGASREEALERILLVGLVVTQTFVRGCLNVFIVVAVFNVLHHSAAEVGYLTAALGTGGLVGDTSSRSSISAPDWSMPTRVTS